MGRPMEVPMDVVILSVGMDPVKGQQNGRTVSVSPWNRTVILRALVGF
ncbi:MAG: hypothetical protein Ct9H300mP28_02620 [Pseudomonadota bacterium]|nr:MAG: hypothetical protein Ct9H300mP28_02620 [Pseudomonadota bacterium]